MFGRTWVTLSASKILNRVKELEAQAAKRGPANNWPIPKYWAVTYHNIAAEIPPDYRALCRMLYFLWWGSFIIVWFNFLAITIEAVSEDDDVCLSSFFFMESEVQGIGISID